MRLVGLGILMHVTGTCIERFGDDPCQTIGHNRFRVVSSCDLYLETCRDIFWGSEARTELKYSEEGPGSSLPLTCAEAEALLRNGGLLSGSVEVAETGRVKQHIPAWYDADRSVEANTAAGFENVLAFIDTELSPLLKEVPFLSFGERGTVVGDVEFLESLNAEENDQKFIQIAEAWRLDSRWKEFQELVIFWLSEADVSRFDEGSSFLARLNPFARLYVKLRRTVFDRKMESEFFTRPIVVEVTEKFKFGSEPILYRKVTRHVNINSVERLLKAINPRAGQITSQIRLSAPAILPRDDKGDEDLLTSLEGIVSQHLLSGDGIPPPPSSPQLSVEHLCSKVMQFSAFISWFWRSSHRRKCRLMYSLFKMCSPSAEIRQEIFAYLSQGVLIADAFRLGRLPPTTITLPWERSQLVEASRHLLEQGYQQLLFRVLIVRFLDTPAEGNVGPRNHWLSIMFEEYFKPGNGLFECSDDDACSFLKPIAGSSFSPSEMAAAGRLIGLGITYGITIGARLAPCGLYALWNPREEVADLESCVKAEDSAFVKNLNKLEEIATGQDQEAAKLVLADFDLTTPETLSEFKKKQLYEKGIGSIKEALVAIKKGINQIIMRGTLQLFTQAEFELMVNGIPNLSAETLWAGIVFRNLPQGSQLSDWLRSIIQTQDEKFRFAFNRFVTGLLQPPVKSGEPWIKVRVETSLHPDSLPKAQTCFSTLMLPLYPDLETFTRKLVQAVTEANQSLELE
jgi:hypothetical protein